MRIQLFLDMKQHHWVDARDVYSVQRDAVPYSRTESSATPLRKAHKRASPCIFMQTKVGRLMTNWFAGGKGGMSKYGTAN
jgi:hypothetical protein